MQKDFLPDVAWPVAIEALPFDLKSSSMKGEKAPKKRRRLRDIPLWPWPLLSLLCLLLCALGLLAGLIAALLALSKAPIPIGNRTCDDFPRSSPKSTTLSSTTSRASTTNNCGPSCLFQSWIDNTPPLARWFYEDTFVDPVGGYNPLSSSQFPTFGTGYVGQAAIFDASAKQAIFTRFIPLNNANFTVEAWIKPTGYPNYQDHSIVGLCPSKIRDKCLHINIRRRKLYFGFYYDDVPGNALIALNQWIHIAFVFDIVSKKQSIYLNGLLDGENIAADVLHIESANFTIGVNEGVTYPNSYYQGYIDQLIVHGQAKPACEILERATLAAHFKFDAAAPYADAGPNAVANAVSQTSIVSGHTGEAVFVTGSTTSYFQAWGLTSFGVSDQPFSISFWMQPQSRSGTIVHLSTSSSGTGPVCFSLLGFSATGAIVAQVLTGFDTIASATDPNTSSNSPWILVVQTWSPTNGIRLYVDNVLVGVAAASTFVASGTTPNHLTLGSCLNGCAECPSGSINTAGSFMGSIDDWRLFNRELTADDVCALYFTS